MQTGLTANLVGGTAIGAIIAAGFGLGWLFWSLQAVHKVTAETAIELELGGLVLIAVGVYVLRQAKRWPRVAGDPSMGRRFAWINVVEWTAIIAVVLCFSRLHIDAYGGSAITAIVGLHYFPLARLFHFPMHYVTGAVLVGWGGASALLFHGNTLQGAAALGTGAILWMSAATMLLVVMRKMAAGSALQISK